jgi:hypothetical protein
MKRFYQFTDMIIMLLMLLKNDPAPESTSIGHIL